MSKKCVICGYEPGMFERTKLDNGEFVCSMCTNRVELSSGFSKQRLKQSTPEEIKERIEFVKERNIINQERISKFKLTFDTGHVWFDDENKWFAITRGLIKSKIDKSYIFKYDEIVGYELVDDGGTIARGGTGKALLGGAVFGTAGAIAGGTSKTMTPTCTQLELIIMTNNVDYPTATVRYINQETNKNSMIYRTGIDNAQRIISKIKSIMEQTQEEKDEEQSAQTYSAADEIKKFKELLDMGAITEEEFEMKKKQLLGL